MKPSGAVLDEVDSGFRRDPPAFCFRCGHGGSLGFGHFSCSQTLQGTDKYVLRMADDDWDPDLDFPGLDSSAVITDVGVDQFVLCQQVGAFLGRIYDTVQWWVAVCGTVRQPLTGIGFLVWIGFFLAFPPYPFKTPFLRETQKNPKCDVETTTRWPFFLTIEYRLSQNLRYRIRYRDLPRAKFEGLVINVLRGLLLTRESRDIRRNSIRYIFQGFLTKIRLEKSGLCFRLSLTWAIHARATLLWRPLNLSRGRSRR